MSIDWGDGAYERTAEALVEAAEHVVGVAGLRPGERVLDLGCGTGNGALAATPDGIVGLFARHAADVSVTEARIAFTADSPEAWFAEVEAFHPAWRAFRAARAAEWPEVRARSVAALVAGNEDPEAFRATSRYLITEVRPPCPRAATCQVGSAP